MLQATIVFLLLASGDVRTFIVEDDGVCETLQIMQENGSLWAEDVDLPRQHPVSVSCGCTLIDEEIEGEAS